MVLPVTFTVPGIRTLSRSVTVNVPARIEPGSMASFSVTLTLAGAAPVAAALGEVEATAGPVVSFVFRPTF